MPFNTYDNRATGFLYVTPRQTQIRVAIYDASYEVMLEAITTNRMGRSGFEPAMLPVLIDAMKSGIEINIIATFAGNQPSGSHNYMTYKPKELGGGVITCADNGNPPCSVTITKKDFPEFLAQLEALLIKRPVQLDQFERNIEQITEMDRYKAEMSRDRRFLKDNPGFIEKIREFVNERRFTFAEREFYRVYLKWNEDHPVDMAKIASTPGGQEVLRRIVDALKKPN